MCVHFDYLQVTESLAGVAGFPVELPLMLVRHDLRYSSVYLLGESF